MYSECLSGNFLISLQVIVFCSLLALLIRSSVMLRSVSMLIVNICLKWMEMTNSLFADGTREYLSMLDYHWCVQGHLGIHRSGQTHIDVEDVSTYVSWFGIDCCNVRWKACESVRLHHHRKSFPDCLKAWMVLRPLCSHKEGYSMTFKPHFKHCGEQWNSQISYSMSLSLTLLLILLRNHAFQSPVIATWLWAKY